MQTMENYIAKGQRGTKVFTEEEDWNVRSYRQWLAESESLTPQQSDFARLYVESGNSRESALQAGYNPNNVDSQASQLLHNPKVRARIKALRFQGIERAGISPDRIVTELFDTYKESRSKEQFSAAVKALELLGREVGLFNPEKRQTTTVTHKIEDLIETIEAKPLPEEADWSR